jgi:hypothetical protein
MTPKKLTRETPVEEILVILDRRLKKAADVARLLPGPWDRRVNERIVGLAAVVKRQRRDVVKCRGDAGAVSPGEPSPASDAVHARPRSHETETVFTRDSGAFQATAAGCAGDPDALVRTRRRERRLV